ncbi:MAG: ABC transporter ATP-binding protein [Acidimicrobiia bacterium]|nr:ABC transporter ATP-binding protein [Acidimicrobiia bacterium]
MTAAPALSLRGVGVVRDGRALLEEVDWEVGSHERWAVLGPNGSGKTTLLRICGAELHPTAGRVEVLGGRLGRVDVRALRSRIGWVSGALTRLLRPGITAREVVVTGRRAALETWWDAFTPGDWARADALLAEAGMAAVAERPFGVISEGERQQVLIARALMGEPELLLLDEPAAGLDLGARERLVARLADLAADPSTPPLVLVTHHAEEIPPGTTHALLLRGGRVVTAGPVGDALTTDSVSAAFSVAVTVTRDGGRWSTRAR